MPTIYFAGINTCSFLRETESKDSLRVYNEFVPVLFDDITHIEIGWDYFLVWKNSNLYICGKIISKDADKHQELLTIPNNPELKFKQAIAGPSEVTALTENYEIWVYDVYKRTWKKVFNFISGTKTEESEYVVKIAQGRCTVALTNLGRVFNIPLSLNNPNIVKFVDFSCGFDHTLLLTGNGDVYSVGMGTRGQLGHGDLEDCDEPKLIEALAGLKVVCISAGGWHNAVVTSQGDLYTWGWNERGQLGQINVESVAALPTIVDFTNETGEVLELNIHKVQCGNRFTICQTDSGTLWGCGSNKYGELGMPKISGTFIKKFVTLELNIVEPIKDFKCREWGTCIYT